MGLWRSRAIWSPGGSGAPVLKRRRANAEQQFLVTRNPALLPHFYDVVLRFTRARVPAARRRFELCMLPERPAPGTRYALHIPWLQDPVQQWSQSLYDFVLELTAELDALGTPTINRVDRLVNASKSNGARLMASVGIRTPRAVPIEDHEQFRETLLGLELPLIVRDDWGHASADALERGSVIRCETRAQAQRVELERFARPVAIEFVDTRDPRDGLYRKYRYVAAGDVGATHHLQVQDHWFVKGEGQLYSQAIREEELAFLGAPDPNRELFHEALRALGLDFVAFDYSYDAAGRLVVWEANPFPLLHFMKGRRVYRKRAMERTLGAMLHLYHTRAGLPVPEEVADLLAFTA